MEETSPADLDIKRLKGVGPRKAALLQSLGIRTVADALMHLPFRYIDRSAMLPIRSLLPGETQTVVARVVGADVLDLKRGGAPLFAGARGYKKGGLTLLEVSVTDGTGILKAKWFNRPYLKAQFPPGREVSLSGVFKITPWGFEMENPEYEFFEGEGERIHTGRVVPVYRTTEGLSPKALRAVIHDALTRHLGAVREWLPPEIASRCGLPDLASSIRECHFPAEGVDVAALNTWRTPAQRRLAFGELFTIELGLAVIRQRRAEEPGISCAPPGKLRERLRARLPFSLTPAQERVLAEIDADMRAPRPMNRLVQGDVGSGKTVVALMAMLSAVECGAQAALMAPTEILAGQHYINIREHVEALGLRAALLTGSVKDRQDEAVASGEAQVVVGTHALLEEGVSFARLGLAVIDEQHRFGVEQRARLRKKARGANPDVLVMTATPIPRTLALTLYGDLDYSAIDELPPGRTPVSTRVCTEGEKREVYAEIEREVRAGGQVYVVYPAIEESEGANLKNAIQGEEGMRRMFPSFRIALLHGRLRPAEREAIMGGFTRGEMDILVCTTVIEVGVDIPNAALMVVVHAERFGLAQLHQLRGRVGRGMRASRCLLLRYGGGEDADRRLGVMVKTTDGFAIAEEDLLIRGPGEFLGTRQSGLPDMRVADIARDAAVLDEARREAFDLVREDPALGRHPALRAAVEEYWRGKVDLFRTA